MVLQSSASVQSNEQFICVKTDRAWTKPSLAISQSCPHKFDDSTIPAERSSCGKKRCSILNLRRHWACSITIRPLGHRSSSTSSIGQVHAPVAATMFARAAARAGSSTARGGTTKIATVSREIITAQQTDALEQDVRPISLTMHHSEMPRLRARSRPPGPALRQHPPAQQ